jgi:HK97 family phage major capsid protein
MFAHFFQSFQFRHQEVAFLRLEKPPMSKQLRELQARKSDLVKEARALTDIAAQENRDLSDEDVAKFNGLKSRIDTTSAAIDRESALISEEAQMGIHAAANFSSVLVSDNRDLDPKHGFQSLGEFLQKVCHAQKPGNAIDERLLIGTGRGAVAPSNFGSEGSAQDGGFFVPPQFSQDIFQLSLGEDSLLPLTDNVEVSGNTMAFPKDETTPWGTNGIRAYWQGEASSAVTSKPVLGLATLRLKKLMALVPATDELLDDTNALSSYLPDKIASSIRWKTNESILFGSGTGVPVGCLNAGATVTVAKESGQATQTLVPQNLAKMIARLPSGSFANAVWIVNNDVLPALFTLTLGSYPIYLPTGLNVGGMQVSPYGTLLGRPLYVSQHANTFSAQGDILLVDLKYYQTITKSGGMQTATSMHLYFDADLTAFRTTFRMDGQSKLAAPITPAKGATSMSPFIQLAAR